jgi:hypothetical protein
MVKLNVICFLHAFLIGLINEYIHRRNSANEIEKKTYLQLNALELFRAYTISYDINNTNC